MRLRLLLLALLALTACRNPFAPRRALRCEVTGTLTVPYISTDGRDTSFVTITTEWCE